MASDNQEPPLKRTKLSPKLKELDAHTSLIPQIDGASSEESPIMTMDVSRELEVGITDFITTAQAGFRGTLKKRYTDFLVNEIQPDGEVVHLRTTAVGNMGPRGGGDVKVKDAPDNSDSPVQTQPTTSDAAARWQKYATENQKLAAEESGVSDLPPVTDSSPVPVEHISKLLVCLSEKTTEDLLALYNKILARPDAKPRDHGHVKCPIPEDKEIRTTIHQDVRNIFKSKIDSSTDKDQGIITFAAVASTNRHLFHDRPTHGNQKRQHGRLGWADRGGEFLHFSLFKENKDTMEVISFIAKQLRVNPKMFQFAGTKDRRAVTVQRVSAFRLEVGRLAQQNRMLRNSAVGDFTYHPRGLELGDLTGNEFVITLRNCGWEDSKDLSLPEKTAAAEQAVRDSLKSLHEDGFFNYYGLQRFGTFSTGTHTVGVKILQGDFQGACEAILHYDPHVISSAHNPDAKDRIGADDKARAEAIEMFEATGKSDKPLWKLPKKFSAEANIIRHLSRFNTDHTGAIQTINRNLKLMYVHAYQSLVWNFAVGERWKLYGNNVVEGDLVLVNDEKTTETTTAAVPETDADGEIVVQPEGADRAKPVEDMFQRARPLTASEAACGKYNIFDVVLPLPGFDVLYPSNAMTDFYKTFMASDKGGGLDPFDMRRKQRDFSLSGSYRKVLARIGSEYEVSVRAYTKDDEQFVSTDWEVMRGNSEGQKSHSATGANGSAAQTEDKPAEQEETSKLAVVLKIQLGSSQYATMALRELSKNGIQAYKPDFGGR